MSSGKVVEGKPDLHSKCLATIDEVFLLKLDSGDSSVNRERKRNELYPKILKEGEHYNFVSTVHR